MVIVPASSGLMGILPSHAPTVAQLRSGVVEVHNGDHKESYFVSSGFAFVHKDVGPFLTHAMQMATCGFCLLTSVVSTL